MVARRLPSAGCWMEVAAPSPPQLQVAHVSSLHFNIAQKTARCPSGTAYSNLHQNALAPAAAATNPTQAELKRPFNSETLLNN